MKVWIVLAMVLLLGFTGSLIMSQRRLVPSKVSGFIEADEIRVGSRIGGRVAEVLVREGQRVTVGQPLVRLEPFDLVERLTEAQSVLAARRSELAKMEAGLRPQEIAQAKARLDNIQANVDKLKNGPLPEELAAGNARLELATAQLERARKSHARTTDLFNQGNRAVSREEMDQAIELFKVAESSEHVRREELQLLKRGTRAEDLAAAQAGLEEAAQAYALAVAGFRSEDIAQARAQTQAAQAIVDAINKQIQELLITSGVEGIVDAMQLRPGDLVAPNAPVLSLIDTRRLWIRAYIPEDQLALQIDSLYPITVDSFPEQRFTAKLVFISTVAEFTPRNIQTADERAKQVFKIKLDLVDGLDRLRPGMAADVWMGAHDRAASMP